MAQRYQPDIRSFAQIEKEWQEIQKLEIKNKFKAMKKIANDICNAYKAKDIEATHLKFYMEVLNKIHKMTDTPRSKIALSKMTLLWLALTGNADAKIIKKINGKINLETATIAVTDAHYSKEILNLYSPYVEKKIVEVMNEGKTYIWSTGFDGSFNLQLRWIDSLEPVLSPKEYKCVINSTETAILNIPTGVLFVSDPCAVEVEKERLSIQVEPGQYKVVVFHFHIESTVDSFYIVLCKTTEEASNQFNQVGTI